MPVKVTTIEVWAGDIQDRPGGLADVLARLEASGTNLECLISRRQPEKPGTGVLFVTPIKGKKQQDAARASGLSPARNIGSLRIEGPDAPGVGAILSRAIADAGINVRGVSAFRFGKNSVAYVSLDSTADANRAAAAVKKAASTKAPRATKKATSRR